MKPRKATTLVIEPVSQPIPPHQAHHEGDHDAAPEMPDFLRDPDDVSPDLPEDKTPIAAPSGMMLQHAGARPYQQLRPVLLGFGGVLVVVIAFLSGAAFSARRSTPEPALEVAPTVTAEMLEPVAPLAPSVQALPPEPEPEPELEPQPQPQLQAEVALPPELAPIPVPATEPDTILLAVTVSPPDAEVRIDGQAMPSNPFVARFPRSVDTHRIRVTAPGYQSKERLVSFGDNVTLDLSLTPAAVAAPVARERPARRPPPASRRASPPPSLRESRSSAVAASPQPAPGPTIELLPRPLESDPSRRRRIEARDPYADDSP